MKFAIGLFVTAIVTYLLRMVPLVLCKKQITNRFLLSFLSYIPCTVLAVMTFPDIFYSTSSMISAVVGCVIAFILAFFNKGLLTTALCSSAGVLICELLMKII